MFICYDFLLNHIFKCVSIVIRFSILHNLYFFFCCSKEKMMRKIIFYCYEVFNRAGEAKPTTKKMNKWEKIFPFIFLQQQNKKKEEENRKMASERNKNKTKMKWWFFISVFFFFFIIILLRPLFVFFCFVLLLCRITKIFDGYSNWKNIKDKFFFYLSNDTVSFCFRW